MTIYLRSHLSPNDPCSYNERESECSRKPNQSSGKCVIRVDSCFFMSLRDSDMLLCVPIQNHSSALWNASMVFPILSKQVSEEMDIVQKQGT